MELRMPTGFNYKIISSCCDSKDVFEFKARADIHDENQAKSWLKEFSDITLTTWRVRRTYPCSGCKMLYKREFRCRYNQPQFTTEKSTRKSTNTGCPAKIIIQIKKFRKRSRAKDDPFMPDFPCILQIYFDHNHDVGTPNALRHRDVSEEVKEKIRQLFRNGHSPVSAYRKIQMESSMQHHGRTYMRSLDRKFCPDKQFYYNLYNAEFNKHKRDRCAVAEHLPNIFSNETPAAVGSTMGSNNSTMGLPLELQRLSQNGELEIHECIVPDVPSLEWEASLLRFQDCMAHFSDRVEEMENKEAVDAFVDNYRKYLVTNDSLVVAMSQFGVPGTSGLLENGLPFSEKHQTRVPVHDNKRLVGTDIGSCNSSTEHSYTVC